MHFYIMWTIVYVCVCVHVSELSRYNSYVDLCLLGINKFYPAKQVLFANEAEK